MLPQLKQILSYLFRRRLRTLLTLSAISIGAFPLAVGGSVGEFISEMMTRAQTTASSQPIPLYPKDPRIPLNEGTLHQIRRVPGVRGTLQFFRERLDPKRQGFSLMGPEEFIGTTSDIPGLEYFFLKFDNPGIKLLKGHLPAPSSRQEAIAGYEIAQRHGWQLGQVIDIRDHPFTIVGIWERAPDEPANYVQISYEAARHVIGNNGDIGAVAILLEPKADGDQVVKQIMAQVDGVRLRSFRETIDEANRNMVMYNLILMAFASLALLVAGSTITTTMVTAVSERTHDIGLKKALGASDRDILMEVMAEAGVIGGLGGSLSVLVAWGGAHWVNGLTDAEWGMRILRVTPRLATNVVLFTVILGMVSGLYPAWAAARLDPIRALSGSVSDDSARGHLLGRIIYQCSRHARRILTIGGICLGIFGLVAMGSLSESLEQTIESAEAGTTDRIAVVAPPSGSSLITIQHIIERTPGVRGTIVASGSTGGPLVEIPNNDSFGTFYGIDSPGGELDFNTPFQVHLWKGRFLLPDSLRETVVGFDLAKRYGLDLGSTLTIRDRDYIVTGIYERGNFGLAAAQFNKTAFISMAAFRRALRQPGGGYITALIAPDQNPESIAQQIHQQLPDVVTVTARQAAQDIRQMLAVFVVLISLSGILGIIVGGLSVTNTMFIAVSERTQEIGLKKAVGASDRNILTEVITDSGKLGGIGGLVGLVSAWAIVQLVNTVTMVAENMRVLALTPRLAAGAMIFTVILGALAGLLPARKASRVDPVIALRAE